MWMTSQCYRSWSDPAHPRGVIKLRWQQHILAQTQTEMKVEKAAIQANWEWFRTWYRNGVRSRDFHGAIKNQRAWGGNVKGNGFFFFFFFFHGQRFRTFVLSPIFVRNFLSGLMFGCSNYRKVFTAQCDLLLFSSTQSRDKHISPSWHLLSLKGGLAVFSLLCGASLWFKDDMSVHDRMPYALLTYVNI